MNERRETLYRHAYHLRDMVLQMTTAAGSGHITSCLSAADIIAALFFEVMHYDMHRYDDPKNDRFIMSKGHAAPLLYAVWHELGVLSSEELMTLRQCGSRLEGHPTRRFPFTETATGSLGQGLSVALGYALHARRHQMRPYTYVLLGDSECAEGSIWEAAAVASFYQLDTIIAIVDMNRLGQSTETMDDRHAEIVAHKWEAFGWQALLVDGHDILKLLNVFEQARAVRDKPSVIIAQTIKGKGIAICEDQAGFHGKAFQREHLVQLREELAHRYHMPLRPLLPASHVLPICNNDAVEAPVVLYKGYVSLIEYRKTSYSLRRAYGEALRELGGHISRLVVLDAEVKNSTYAELFEQRYPERFTQCFVAEQNMVGMAVGMALRGDVPFVSTFGSFLTRAHDQIRMAAIDCVPLRLVGTHAGVSVGEDGPSQMALEDVALMRSLPNSVVLQPADAISCNALVQAMTEHQQGISYLRLLRQDTPILYTCADVFTIGGGHVIHCSPKPVVCIIGSGATVHEALSAAKMLERDGIGCTVIDCYSLKPLPTLLLQGEIQQAHSRCVVVEDHYPEGGLGEAIAQVMVNKNIQLISLAVRKIPMSGSGEQLRAYMHIDAQAIYHAVQALTLR